MARLICKIMGAVFILVAVWGFIDGDNVLIFPINTLHNIVHLVSGAAALAAGLYSEQAAKWFCIVFGLVYALVGVLGLLNIGPVVDMLNLHHPNHPTHADDILHLAIAAVFLIAGLVPQRPVQGQAAPL